MQVNQADLAHCAQERIEIPECVQPFGGLLVCDPSSSRILRYSAGACRLLRCEDLLGRCLTDLIPLLLAHWQRLSEQPPLAPVRINHLSLEVKTLDVLVHAVPTQTVWTVELFPAHDLQETFQLESALFTQMSDAINKLRALPSLSEFWTSSSDMLRSVLGYERVMIYRFDADGSGQVIAESTAEGVPVKYLHLHFPGSDIPAQARVLYERNLLRVIADVDAEPEPLLGDATEPLDQSLCLLRQPSPLHLQYLRNMGVRATLTVSLLQEGKLWGMLACHHPEPRMPPQHLSRSLLLACNLLGAAFNTQLFTLLRIEQLQQDKARAEQLESLAKRLRKLEYWEQWREEIRRFLSQQLSLAQLEVTRLPAASAVLPHRGDEVSSPPHEAWLRVPGGQGFDGFAIHLIKAPDATDRMWAGDPSEHEPVPLKNGQVVLGPRGSFESWREQRDRQPLPWTEAEQTFMRRIQRLLHELLQLRLVRQQEEHLAVLGAALQQSREMIIVSTADKDPATGGRRIVYVNEALLAGTLYERDELMGRSPSMFQGPETDPLVVQRMSRQLTAGEPVAETLRNYKKNGRPHWLDLRIHPLRNVAGKITHFVSVQRDVTQQLESLAQLHQKNAFLTRLTELLPGAVFVFRRSPAADYSFNFTTEVFQSLFGMDSLRPSQTAFIEAIHRDDLDTVQGSIERSAQNLSRWRQRFRVRGQKGQGYRTLEGLSDPIREDDGTVIWFGIVFDVTEQVEVEMALNEALVEHQATLDAIPEQLIEIDELGQISNAHARGDTILGQAANELVGRRVIDLLPEEAAYPTAMAMINYPLWDDAFPSTNVKDYKAETLGFATVEFSFPDSVRYPTIPVRTEGGLVFPRRGKANIAAPELRLAIWLGAEIKIIRGVVIPQKKNSPVFRGFIQDCIRKRMEAGKGTLEGLFWKEISNSTYGKMAQGLRPRRLYDMRSQDTKPLEPSAITNCAFAAYTTSLTRAILGELMNALPQDKMVLSCTTDGFITNATDDQIKTIVENGQFSNLYAWQREQLVGSDVVVETKHEVTRPLGWRVRGQATLEPGKKRSKGDDYNILLARAGVYIKPEFEGVREQNDEIVRMFFSRFPDAYVNVYGSMGLREMIENDADFVSKELVRRLSMEYDWKRKPHGLTHSQRYDHIAFSTVPWDTVDEYNAAREAWQDYTKDEKKCLKTLDDFKDWAKMLFLKTSLEGDAAKFLRKKNGDLQRLRKQLCSAFVHGQAGVTFDHKVTRPEFSKLLTQLGMPCKKYDLDNEVKVDFVPQQVPPTDEVKAMLKKVKRQIPSLVAEQLLYQVRPGVGTDLMRLEPCQFTQLVD